jgi:hypothetical protein
VTISVVLEKDDGLFCSDWRPATSSPRLARGLSLSKAAESKGAVFSQLISGGNRSPEPVEGNAEGAELPHGYVAEKTNPGASELRKSPSSLENRPYAKLSRIGTVL